MTEDIDDILGDISSENFWESDDDSAVQPPEQLQALWESVSTGISHTEELLSRSQQIFDKFDQDSKFIVQLTQQTERRAYEISEIHTELEKIHQNVIAVVADLGGADGLELLRQQHQAVLATLKEFQSGTHRLQQLTTETSRTEALLEGRLTEFQQRIDEINRIIAVAQGELVRQAMSLVGEVHQRSLADRQPDMAINAETDPFSAEVAADYPPDMAATTDTATHAEVEALRQEVQAGMNYMAEMHTAYEQMYAEVGQALQTLQTLMQEHRDAPAAPPRVSIADMTTAATAGTGVTPELENELRSLAKTDAIISAISEMNADTAADLIEEADDFDFNFDEDEYVAESLIADDEPTVVETPISSLIEELEEEPLVVVEPKTTLQSTRSTTLQTETSSPPSQPSEAGLSIAETAPSQPEPLPRSQPVVYPTYPEPPTQEPPQISVEQVRAEVHGLAQQAKLEREAMQREQKQKLKAIEQKYQSLRIWLIAVTVLAVLSLGTTAYSLLMK